MGNQIGNETFRVVNINKPNFHKLHCWVFDFQTLLSLRGKTEISCVFFFGNAKLKKNPFQESYFCYFDLVELIFLNSPFHLLRGCLKASNLLAPWDLE